MFGASHISAGPASMIGVPIAISGARRPHVASGKQLSRFAVAESASRATNGPLNASMKPHTMVTTPSAVTSA